MSSATSLREMLHRDDLIVAPGAFDCLTANLVERAGFPAVYMTGAGTAASRAGVPDYGLATMSELVDNAGCIARAVSIPVIADADTGYGNELNVIRTVREYSSRGVAAIHIEDQTFPKKCGHLDGKTLVSRHEYVSKIRAAAEAREGSDFVIIARTDARAVEGLDAAIERVNACFDVGADVAFVEAPESLDEVREIPRRVMGPCLLNLVPGGKTPVVTLEQARQFGYRIAILSGLLFFATILACEDALDWVQTRGEHPIASRPLTPKDVFRRLGSERWDEYRERFS